MYCPNCGSQVGDSKFCPKCGENLKAVIPSQTPAETPVEEIESSKKVETSQTEPITTPPEPETPKPITPPPETPKPKPLTKPPETPKETETITELENPESTPSTTAQATYSLTEFASKTLHKDIGLETFELENKYLLDVNLDGKVWGKLGSMVAYTGNVRFKRQSSLEQGIDKFVKKTLTGESIHIMKIKGQGHVYLADMGKQITLINLQNEKMYVNGNNILAFEEGIDWDIKMMTSGSSMMSGGLFNIKLQGTGMVAITTHYTPLTIRVTPDATVMTDPHATVAWSSGLSTSVKMDVDFKTLLGKDSRETIQMKFKGDGFIIVQPYEE
jgi:uncharacterized protein (AIM24 family)